MRRFLALLLLAGCGSEDGGGGRGAGEGALPGLDPAANQAAADPAALEARAAAALVGALHDPASARYSNIRAGSGNAVCGDVDSKQPDGKYSGFRPFAVSPEGVGVVSRTTTVMFNDPSDLFPDFYIRYCASPEELENLGGRVARGDPALTTPIDEQTLNSVAPAPELPTTIPADPPQPAPAANAPEPPRREPPATAAPSGTGEEDSFLKAVKRPTEAK